MRSILAALALGALGLSAAAAAQQPDDATQWAPLYADDEGEYLFDPASVQRQGDVVRFRLRALVAQPELEGFASAVMGWEVDCAAQTIGLHSAEIYNAEGTALKSLTVPSERVERDQLHAGSEESPIYAHFCPGAKALPEPPPPPMLVTVPPGSGPGPGCDCDEATKPEDE